MRVAGSDLELTFQPRKLTLEPRKNGGQNGGQSGGDAMTGSPADQRGDSVLKAISNNPRETAREIADDLGISKRTVERTIKALRECGLISRKGGARGAWQVKAE